MKTGAGLKRTLTSAEITARVKELAPQLLEGFAPRDIAVILGMAAVHRFEANSLLAIEGHPANKVFLILEGQARAFTTTRKGEKVLLLRILPGDPSGGRALLSKPTDYLVSTEAVTNGSALVWKRSAILSLTKQYPRLLENALLIASDYVEIYRDLHIGASSQSAGQRVARVLQSLAKIIGRRVVEGVVLDVSNEELANEANVTIFTVSRLLSEWGRKGLLVKSRGRVVLHSPEELVRRAGWA
ncbi:MAG TPA: Crp/Fnr family transcriptional regulator [Edaphobacter sp.]|jgi:CRP-like cAMP-binding protein|nr:Crp/Fnr family transcriptional regulator [Edaphobacter sp.]